MKNFVVALVLLTSAYSINAQFEGSSFTSTGRGGATTFATDYQAVGINPANLGWEYKFDGKKVATKDVFKQYDNLEDSVKGYGAFLKANPRYKPFLAATTLEEQVAALGRSGYATDPNYAKTVRSIAKGKRLKELGGY